MNKGFDNLAKNNHFKSAGNRRVLRTEWRKTR